MRFSLTLVLIFVFSLFLYLVTDVASLTASEADKNPLQGYVLTDRSGKPESGVRIGLLDLQFETLEALRDKYQLEPSLIQKLSPYVGVTSDKAVQLLKDKPLALTQPEFDTMNQKVTNFWMSQLQKAPPAIRRSRRVTFIFSFLSRQCVQGLGYMDSY
jgi:hypothetical protein